ncbi:hypothetical protein P7K49_000269, partial [Saguinus oedipus]
QRSRRAMTSIAAKGLCRDPAASQCSAWAQCQVACLLVVPQRLELAEAPKSYQLPVLVCGLPEGMQRVPLGLVHSVP